MIYYSTIAVENGKYQFEKYLTNLKGKINENMVLNEKLLIIKYCEIIRELCNNEKISNEVLYKILVREGATGGHINKIV